MELFTEDELDSLEKKHPESWDPVASSPNRHPFDRLFQHARELLRLKAALAAAESVAMRDIPPQPIRAGLCHVVGPRESIAFALVTGLDLRTAKIREMEAQGFELVSVSDNLMAHFRRP